MTPVSMTTERLRRLLVEIHKRDLPYEVCLADDIIGPGGGVYVKARTPVTTRHIGWFESRNPSSKTRPTFMEVDIRRIGSGDSGDGGADELRAELDLGTGGASAAQRRGRAREAASAVGEQAKETARIVRGVHDRLGRRYTRTQLSAPEVVNSFREFEREYRRLHEVVRRAVDEFLGGNTMVMDFIVDYDVDRPDVRHAVRVAALATELRIRTASSRCEEETFNRELVDLFLAGFLHDGGMWNEPYCFPEDHEGRGAALAAGAVGDRAPAGAVEKLVLFHSDWERLAASETVAFAPISSDVLYERFFDAAGAPEDATYLTVEDREGALALAAAERWITELDEARHRGQHHRDLLDGLVDGVALAPSGEFVAALCNMELDTFAPRRASVRLSGALPVHSPRGGRSDRYVRMKVDGYTAGSLGHGSDGASPHLITLFAPDGGEGRRPLKALKPSDEALWERRDNPDNRWYVPAGRFKNLLDWEVTGFLSPAEYDAILGPYEARARRLGLLTPDEES